MENIYTLEEVSKHLRVPEEAIQKEIEIGRLQAFEVSGLIRISEHALGQYKQMAVASPRCKPGAKTQAPNGYAGWLKLQPVSNFMQHWPDGKVEEYKDVQEGIATYEGSEYHVKLGWSVREAGGQARRRWLVKVDRYPTVEFVKCDDDGSGGPEYAASIIKDRRGKQVPVLATLPPEYEQLPTKLYSDEIKGRGMANGQAVVCTVDDFQTMVRHALIRYRFREQRSKQRKASRK